MLFWIGLEPFCRSLYFIFESRYGYTKYSTYLRIRHTFSKQLQNTLVSLTNSGHNSIVLPSNSSWLRGRPLQTL